jgi:NAD(P)-dependent dehydrogenase (short-subunit alcohol dehydrogenase family)
MSNTEELTSLVSSIEARGGKATAIKTDVAVAKDAELMVAHALDQFGRLDYAVNNAGIEGTFAGISDFAEEDWGVRVALKRSPRRLSSCARKRPAI